MLVKSNFFDTFSDKNVLFDNLLFSLDIFRNRCYNVIRLIIKCFLKIFVYINILRQHCVKTVRRLDVALHKQCGGLI